VAQARNEESRAPEFLPRQLRLGLVVPVFNDFPSFMRLCQEIDLLVPQWGAELLVIAVDDGSIATEPLRFDPPLVNICQFELVRLRCNLGHQRAAIAIGLVDAVQRFDLDAVLVADSDGEDRPIDMGRLIAAHYGQRVAVVVARRVKRSEGLRFRIFYALYKAMFRAFTGKRIAFGNLVFVPASSLSHLISMPEIWNHLAASILRSRLPIISVDCVRGSRYNGSSRMNFVSLIIHGLSAVAVFSDVVFARMLTSSVVITALAILTALAATVIRFTTDVAIPGWTTNVVGISMILLAQALLFSMGASLSMLRSRSAAVFLPSVHAQVFIAERITVMGQGSRVRSNVA
jgi:polyisoprenyl-phosphate glycosyltransferase